MSSLDQRRNDRDEGSDEDDMTTTYVAVGKNIIYGVLVGVAAAFVGCQVIFWTTDFKGKKGVLENSFPSDPTSLPYALGADNQTGGYRSSCAYGTSNLSLSSGRDDQRIAFPYYLTNGLVKVDYDGRIEDKTVFEARGAGVQGGIHGLISAIGYTPSTVVPHVRGLWKWMLSHDAPPSRLLDLVRMYFGGLALIPYSLLVASLGIMLCLTALLPIWLSFGPKYSPWRTHAAPFPWGPKLELSVSGVVSTTLWALLVLIMFVPAYAINYLPCLIGGLMTFGIGAMILPEMVLTSLRGDPGKEFRGIVSCNSNSIASVILLCVGIFLRTSSDVPKTISIPVLVGWGVSMAYELFMMT